MFLKHCKSIFYIKNFVGSPGLDTDENINGKFDLYRMRDLKDKKTILVYDKVGKIKIKDSRVSNKSGSLNIKENDFVIAVGARTGSVSYFSDSDTFLAKVQKAYEDNDWVLVIPGQEKENLFKEYEDISGNAIGLGVDTLSRIGKEVGSIFKKD